MRLGKHYVGRCTRTHHIAILKSGRGTYCRYHQAKTRWERFRACWRTERLEQLLDIEEAACDVVRMRAISRQAALNAMPDLIDAVNRAGGPYGRR
jgi:hypothetical protein